MVKDMRLSKIYYELSSLQDYLSLELNATPRNGIRSVKNLHSVNKYLHKLESYDVFYSEIQKLKNANNCYYVTYPNAEISENDYRIYTEAIRSIKDKLIMLSYLYNVTGSKLEDKTLCFSFPENKDLDEIQNFTVNITKALNLISNIQSFEGNIKFKGVESGSEWLYFTVGGAALLTIFEKILTFCKKSVIEGISIYRYYKIAKIKIESMENLDKIQKTLITNYINNEEYFNKLTNEERLTLIQACALITETITNGSKAEIALLEQPKSDATELIDKALVSSLKDIKFLMEPNKVADSDANKENDNQNQN